MSVHYRLVMQAGLEGFAQQPFAVGVAEFAPVVGDIITRDGQTYRVEERHMFHQDERIPEAKAWPVYLTIGFLDLYVKKVVR